MNQLEFETPMTGRVLKVSSATHVISTAWNESLMAVVKELNLTPSQRARVKTLVRRVPKRYTKMVEDLRIRSERQKVHNRKNGSV